MLHKIISGGQTGVDRAGLSAAKQAGIPTGGWMPKGYKAQDGTHPEFATLYNIQEHTSPDYPPRTAQNIKDADGTIRIATNWQSPGEKLTLSIIERYHKPYIDIDPFKNDITPAKAITWLKAHNIKILNIAGNSERTAPGIGEFAEAFLTEMFNLIKSAAPSAPQTTTAQHIQT